jgi:ubiquitin thioesterase protein OTUB1
VENLINSRERDFAVGSSLSILESTKETLDKAGIEKMVYEDFYEDFETLVQSITKPDKDGRTLNTEQLLFAFQQPEGELLGHIIIILLI